MERKKSRRTLRPDHRRSFTDPPERLSEVLAAADEGNVEGLCDGKGKEERSA
jgi:hypothetical protein